MKLVHSAAVLALMVGVAGHTAAQTECPSKCQAAKSQQVTGQARVEADADGDKTIAQIAMENSSFTTLVRLLKAADLADTFNAKGHFTVFAPTDEAFAKLPKATLETLLKPENKAKLQGILKYHVLGASVMSKDVKTMGAETLNGQRVDVKVEKKDGKTWVKVDGATVIMPDVAASNGVIHAIDTVLLPSDKTIVQTAASASTFKTLTTLLTQAGLVDALQGEGPFTVFAPTDDAFAKLPKETLEMLMQPENKEKLVSILKYHVVSGRWFSDAAPKTPKAKTLEGHEVLIKTEKGKVWVDSATVTGADMDASNGVIHVIDTVLMPKM